MYCGVPVRLPGQERDHATPSATAIPLVGREIVRRQSSLLVAPGRWHWVEGRTGGEDAGRWGYLVRATPVQSERRPVAGPAPAGAFEVPVPREPGDAPAFADKRAPAWKNR